MNSGKRKVNTTIAAMVIVLLSFFLGFLILQNSDPLADTAEQGIDTIQKLDELNQELDQ